MIVYTCLITWRKLVPQEIWMHVLLTKIKLLKRYKKEQHQLQ